MELGNYSAAAESFERAVSAPGVDPELVQQAWYQLGTAYRHLHRIEDAQKAFTAYQKLKDEEAQRVQERLKKKREASSVTTQPPPASQNPL